MTQPQDERPDPEDSAQHAASLVALRACEALCAVMFSTVLPWQQTVAWFGAIAAIGAVRHRHVQRPSFRARPREQRKRVYRIYMWVLMSFVGSSCYFLYVPGNLPIQAVLMSYLLGNGTMVTVRLTGDAARTAIALFLAIFPTSIRFVIEGSQDNTLLMLMGIGGMMMAVTMVFMSRAQDASVRFQYEQRRRAEAATNAVAAMGLTKSRFFAAVSHDLRQPVHAIGLYLDPLSRLSQKSHDIVAQRAVEGISQSWRALDDLLSQVLDLTRMDSGVVHADMQACELAPLVSKLVTQHSATAELAGVRIVALVKPGCHAMADDLMLMRVLSNLLDNAIKFSPPGASVVVAVRSSGDKWLLQVRDAGVGIAADAQKKIFEEFVQIGNDSRDRRRGLGLGLAIARRFALLMEGDIEVRSALGRGCCMSVKLQKTAAQEPDRPPEEGLRYLESMPGELMPQPQDMTAPVLPELAVREVLLVEDDSLVASATAQLLRSWGLQVLHVETAADALNEAGYGEVAICDARLPHNASGLDVALAMRELGKKVLLISGETNASLRAAAQQHQLALLTKPVSSTHLLAALQSL
jgi:signal transduction histidine kinase/BarA-like signal transduction histidine kinase